MKTIKNVKSENVLSKKEISFLKGGVDGKKKYKIGNKKVTKEEYKKTVLELSGKPSSL